jgi:oxygen-independent coproporphyrinogen-3 oxidase
MIEKEIILKYNQPGPRYTSYPPANYFQNTLDGRDYAEGVVRSNSEEPENISLYFHVPYCPRLCHFCGCNTSLMSSRHQTGNYFSAMQRELDRIAPLLDGSRKVSQIHWGGGTPNSVPWKYISQVMQQVRTLFTLREDAEVAMECNPAYLSIADIDILASLGFNRVSLGIQDFNESVLRTVNRGTPRVPVREMLEKLRSAGFTGINLDMIYGLPLQTPENFADSVKKAIDAGPDRIVTFSYAHVPWINENQKILEKYGLPSAEQKLELFFTARRLLTENGYIPIGMDHYAKGNDELTVALRKKQLHRNFQGYCTRERTGQVYAFGSSAISQLYGSYWQNYKDPEKYVEEIDYHGLAIERGYRLNREELVIRAVIDEIMCNGYVDFRFIAKDFNTDEEEIKNIVRYDPEKFDRFRTDKLVEIFSSGIRISQEGMLVIRNIAMLFDPLAGKKSARKFSKTI